MKSSGTQIGKTEAHAKRDVSKKEMKAKQETKTKNKRKQKRDTKIKTRLPVI